LYRFAIVTWNGKDRARRDAGLRILQRIEQGTRGYRRVFKASGVAAFHAGVRANVSRTIVLPRGAGAVFGTLFRSTTRAEHAFVEQLEEPEASSIVTTAGSRLIGHYWGRYVSLLRCPDAVRVMRDPSGTLPCFHLVKDGVHLFFSDVDDMAALDVARISIDWAAVNAFVRRQQLPVGLTSLEGLAELRPGECVSIFESAWKSTLVWDPAAIAGNEHRAGFSDVAAALRQVVCRCVSTWASRYRSILLSLSGGLDSSIVLDCLARCESRPELACLTHYGSRADEDERRYARLAAGRACAELIEQPLDACQARLASILGMRRTARLSSYIGSLQRQGAEVRLGRERGVQSVFSGAGGDGLFFQSRADLAVGDFVRSNGIGGRMFGVALDAARIEGCSVWRALICGIRAIGISGIGPAKAWQLLSLSGAPAFDDPLGAQDDPEFTHPLLSQPVIEFCLGVPAHTLIEGGWDRAVARRAFADCLPAEIVRRRAKGNICAFGNALLDANRGWLRDILLGGVLVKERLLDRSRIESSLSGSRPLTDKESAELLHTFFSAEAWVRRWQA
jgi:asparagine synthase (glutamine-hydrolysing)